MTNTFYGPGFPPDPILDRLAEISAWKTATGNDKVSDKAFFEARHLLSKIHKAVPAARPPIHMGGTPRGGISLAWKCASSFLQVEVGSKGTLWACHTRHDELIEEYLPAEEDKIVDIIRDHFFYATGFNGLGFSEEQKSASDGLPH